MFSPTRFYVTRSQREAAFRAVHKAFVRLQTVQGEIDANAPRRRALLPGAEDWLSFNLEQNRLQMKWSERNQAYRMALARFQHYFS